MELNIKVSKKKLNAQTTQCIMIDGIQWKKKKKFLSWRCYIMFLYRLKMKQIFFVNYSTFMLRLVNLTSKCIYVNLIKRIKFCIVVTFSLGNYCHECESLLELPIPTIDKFICRNDLLPDIMKTWQWKWHHRLEDDRVCVCWVWWKHIFMLK